jgi:hypothetical protein
MNVVNNVLASAITQDIASAGVDSALDAVSANGPAAGGSGSGEEHHSYSLYKKKRRGSKNAAPQDEKETLEEVYNRTWEKDEAEYMKSPGDGKRLFRVRITDVRAQDLLAKDM